MSHDFCYPLKEAWKGSTGQRNAVQVRVAYIKRLGALVLTLQPCEVGKKTSEVFGRPVRIALMSDPDHEEKLADMARDNKKKVEAAFNEVKEQVTAKKGKAWEVLTAFAEKNKMTLADGINAETIDTGF